MERSNPTSQNGSSDSPGLVVATFNCRGFNTKIVKNLIEELSTDHKKNIVLGLQETWKYSLPKPFLKEHSANYYFIHESSMDTRKGRKSGRPYGGIAFIVSKAVAFKVRYISKRCLSLLLTKHNIVVNNVYLPANDSRRSVQDNEQAMLEAVGHLGSAHNSSEEEILDCISLGDFNFDPEDQTGRTRIITDFLSSHNYDLNCDLTNRSVYYTHESGRALDRILFTRSICHILHSCAVLLSYANSDHFPVKAEVTLENDSYTPPQKRKYLCWDKASDRAIASFSRLSEKMCAKSLSKFKDNEINGSTLYQELVNNITEAADTCIPKIDPNKTPRRHNIPKWKERISPFKDEVDYWLQVQFLHGGPNRCPEVVKQQLRLSKSRYRREFRILRREIQCNIAEIVTLKNCHRHLFKKPKTAPPAMIDGYSRPAQPSMWRKHFQNVFEAENTPYHGDLLNTITDGITNEDITIFNHIDISDINEVLSDINTNKSYTRHFHWKHLRTDNHAAKKCLVEVLKHFTNNVLRDASIPNWDFFLTQLGLIPKPGKKDYSTKNSWRPISVGTSENWIFEKVLLKRLLPYLHRHNSQFGYKKGHSTAHAIELVRTIERNHDAHICLLDASSAFDKISWRRIRDQLIKRHVPYSLIKIVICQLYSTKISVCGESVFFPRLGVKQGGVLSGILFSACYDDLCNELDKTGVGLLLNTANAFILICVIVYADDVLLIASSPYGLKLLINKTFTFAHRYNDITFNTGKSWILRLGPHQKPAVSVCGIPVTECREYLGVEIGRKADTQSAAAGKLYSRANTLMAQNGELNKCSLLVKNVCIKSYGNVYSIENELNVTSKLRQAHRYMVERVHPNWSDFADLEGPNIRSRRLYTVFGIDSLEVIHRKLRNNFLIKAASHTNDIIRNVIGSLERITI